mmetsp:Transcript_53770/g.123712  ORF Transcript_53770/g.123712 Transcript_53770/m.123712 type:complete len:200 (+) Transcript_53770:234-833(+)
MFYAPRSKKDGITGGRVSVTKVSKARSGAPKAHAIGIFEVTMTGGAHDRRRSTHACHASRYSLRRLLPTHISPRHVQTSSPRESRARASCDISIHESESDALKKLLMLTGPAALLFFFFFFFCVSLWLKSSESELESSRLRFFVFCFSFLLLFFFSFSRSLLMLPPPSPASCFRCSFAARSASSCLRNSRCASSSARAC